MIKYRDKSFCPIWIATGALIALSILPACSEKDVAVISDREEIERYLSGSLDARELFRTDNFINEDTFTIPNDAAVYADVVDSVARTVYFSALPTGELKRYKEPNITVSDAQVEVTDRFYTRRLHISGSDTTSTDAIREIIRYGLFLKLGSDLQPYAGWKLFGFSGGIPAFPLTMTVDGPNNATIVVGGTRYQKFVYARIDPQTGEIGPYVFQTEEAYMRVDQIPTFDAGGNIDISCTSVAGESSYMLMGGFARTGPVTETMNRPTTDIYSFTLTSQFSPPYVWNLLVFQEFRTKVPPYAAWCVPYRVP